MTLLQANEHTHDELACLDVDLLLADAMAENADLKARLAEMEQQVAEANHRAEMAQALSAETEKRFTAAHAEREGLQVQVKMLHEELVAAERDALPTGTLAYGTLSHALILSTYRRVSRVSRGPAPRSVAAAVESALPEVRTAMETAGREALEAVVRREVRRRRRAGRG